MLTIVRREPHNHDFEVWPRRCVAERTLARLCGCRRSSKDYADPTRSSEAWAHVAMANLMLKRLQPSFVTHPLSWTLYIQAA